MTAPSGRSASTGHHPEGVTLGDFDGDGDLDAATANVTSGDVTVMLGAGNGTFLPPTAYQLAAARAIASGDVDGDTVDEILTAPGPGDVFGPHIRGWNYDGAGVQAMAKISFYAYRTLRYGANVTAGRLDGDGFDELVTAPGPGVIFGPQVRGWDYDGAAVVPIAKVSFNALPAMQYGANVAAGDVDGDPFSEIAVVPGPGPSLTSRFLGFDYDNNNVVALPGFDVTPFTTLYGGRLGIGDLSGDGSGDLLAGAGRDPGADSTVLAFAYTGSAMAPTSAGFVPFSMVTYGVNVAGGLLGW